MIQAMLNTTTEDQFLDDDDMDLDAMVDAYLDESDDFNNVTEWSARQAMEDAAQSRTEFASEAESDYQDHVHLRAHRSASFI